MRLAILMANTDESAFADRHPRDGEKWRAVLEPVLPGASLVVYPVKDGVFPDAPLTRFDGFIITGSPASVGDGQEWQGRLEALIRDIVAADVKLFGACYGHQAIARALGGTIGPNPDGKQYGVVESQVIADRLWLGKGPIRLSAAHEEQVTNPPDRVEIIARHPTCPVAGMAMGDNLFTTQYHPEISTAFMAALLDEMQAVLPEDVLQRARASLAQAPENARFARWLARFFAG